MASGEAFEPNFQQIKRVTAGSCEPFGPRLVADRCARQIGVQHLQGQVVGVGQSHRVGMHRFGLHRPHPARQRVLWSLRPWSGIQAGSAGGAGGCGVSGIVDQHGVHQRSRDLFGAIQHRFQSR